MLVLTRKQGQSIVIDDEIEITIVEINSNNVKISIDAPKRVKILRRELINDVKAENIESIGNMEELLKRLK